MESNSWPENMAGDQKRAIRELSEGRELADQLRNMLSSGADSLVAGDLVNKILDSFHKSLLILNLPTSASDEVSEVHATTGGSCDGGPHKSDEDSGESRKTVKDRRGCYKRRRTLEALTKLTSSMTEQDGHAWRKYGQKSILNAKHPRNYYRCTHKFDQGCEATKQVQQTQEDPPLYRTIYYGRHTCTKNLDLHHHPNQFNHNNFDSSSNSILLNFQPSNNKPNAPSFIPFKQNNNGNNYLSSHNNLTPATFGSTTSTELLSPAGSDLGDVISSTTFDHQMDTMVGDHLQFNDDDESNDMLFMDSLLLESY